MKPVTIVTIAQLVSWVTFALGDYIDETYGSSYGFALLASFCLPLLAAILYLIFQKKIHDASVKRWENVVNVLGIWSLETLACSALVFHLLKIGRWPIYQHTVGWENFLNGIEYYLFPFFNLSIPFTLVLLWNLGVLVWRRFDK